MEYMARRITGKFRHLDENLLARMKFELKCLLKSWGMVGPEDFGEPSHEKFPLWAEVEFLDNIVQFEIQCNPSIIRQMEH